MASPTYERLIRYIVESMTPEKVLALETPTDDPEAAQLVSVLKSQVADVANPLDIEQPFPNQLELLAMPHDERLKWIERSFVLAANENFELFEAFGEEEF
jgi:hypothetical protein